MNRSILFVYFSNPLGLLTIQENVKNFRLLSKNNITLLNTYPKVKIPADVNLNNFDGILIDSTLAYFPKTLDELDENIHVKLKDYDGAKILLKQDEHIHSHETARIIGQKKIDLVFTCLDESQILKVYPRHLVGEAQFIQQLTGYFSDTLIKLANSMEYTRCIDISYRGSIQPLQCGRLGYEKWNIGQSVYNKLIGKHVKTDISSYWHDRISGNDWIKFLSASKSVLGVESGSNLFDFNGEVEKDCLLYEHQNNKLKQNPEEFYKKAHETFLFKYEGNVEYAQISPRHFEAASTKTLQILYEGRYSNIFVPYKHYVPLKKDLSNLEEVEEVLFNSSKRQQVTDCAYEEIVMNEKFHYKRKVEQFDLLVEKICKEKNIESSFLYNSRNHSPQSAPTARIAVMKVAAGFF